MEIYPAIDLRAGQCVRLLKGDFNQATHYHDDPLAMADDFAAQGAKWLHVIDLDGAEQGKTQQSKIIKKIVRHTDLLVQVGGGIRKTDHIKQLLDSGASRVIIGSLAVSAPDTVMKWFKQFGSEHIVLALDIRYHTDKQPYIATHGWQDLSDIKLFDLIAQYQSAGLKHILCTDIDRDGTLEGPNLNLYHSLTEQFPELHLQASGGIGQLSDLEKLRRIPAAGAIVGRALYEKKFTLQEALTC